MQREYDDLRMEYQKSHSRFQQKVAELMNEQIYLRKTLSVKKSLALKEEKKDQDLLANLVRESNECIDVFIIMLHLRFLLLSFPLSFLST